MLTVMSNAGLQSQQWGRKIGAARAVKALCKLGGKGSMSQHAISIARQLLQVHAHALSSFQIRQHSPSVNCMPGISPSIFQGHSDPMSPELRRAENFSGCRGYNDILPSFDCEVLCRKYLGGCGMARRWCSELWETSL